jgi:hypothetical protein
MLAVLVLLALGHHHESIEPDSMLVEKLRLSIAIFGCGADLRLLVCK